MKIQKVHLLFLIAVTVLTQATYATTNTGAQTFTFSGQLTNLSDNPLLDPSVVVDVKIYNPSATCILYEERQTIDTTSTNGAFILQVGSPTGSSKRVTGIDPGNTMSLIFQNNAAIVGSSCTYAPVSGDSRLMRVTISPSTTGTVEVLSPDSVLGSVPNALVAESLQGLDRDHVLAIDSSTSLNQTNVANIFSPVNYALLNSMLAGTSPSYVQSSTTNGAQIPTLTVAPVSPAAGAFWFNTNLQSLQLWNGSSFNTILTSASPNQWTATGSQIYYGSGNVGIGISNPQYTLHVVGNAGLSTGTSWINASDRRLKNIDGDYEYGLDEILRLHTVRFHYKRGNALGIPSDHPMTGIIAQEVQDVIPDAIHKRKDGYLELNIDPIHWAVVNSIKELYAKWSSDSVEKSAEIQTLKSQVLELKLLICKDHPEAKVCENL